MQTTIQYKIARSAEEFEHGKVMFQEYAGSLSFDISFQDFDEELENISKKYNLPTGGLVLAYQDNAVVGCAGVRFLEEGISELKRLYVSNSMRGRRIGYTLLNQSLQLGRALGYKKMRLDTIEEMTKAISMYQSAGFYEIPPYCFNPMAGAKYMEIVL